MASSAMTPARRKWTQFVGTIGALANWGIPLAALTNIYNNQEPKQIDPRMTSALAVYSFFFMRWSLAITPPNYPLLLCHICNEAAQLVQLGRWAQYAWGQPKEQEVKAD